MWRQFVMNPRKIQDRRDLPNQMIVRHDRHRGRTHRTAAPEDAIKCLVGAVLIDQNDEWHTQNRYMQIEGFAEPAALAIDQPPLQITPKAA